MQTMYENLCEVIPGGVNSPVRSCKAVGQRPLIAERGAGDLVYDIEGRSYIDYCGSWGALILGHADRGILDAVQKRMALGTSFGITTPVEERLAREISRLVPSIQKIRFVSSGTEATMSAVRLARGFTKRSLLVKFTGHYHGHADFFLVKAGSGLTGLTPTSMSEGIPEDFIKHTACLPFNQTELSENFLQQHRNEIAAVILEPMAANMGLVPAQDRFLHMLRETTSKIGALLIFDEVVTGFRVGLRGAQGVYKITPDLTCLGKIVGGGFPAAAFGGRSEIMECLAPLGKVYQAGTLSGNPVAMEAGWQVLQRLQEPHFYEELEEKTRLLTDPIEEWLEKRPEVAVFLRRFGSMFTLFFGRRSVESMEEAATLDLEQFARFFRFLFDHGVYIPPLQYETWFVSSAHEEKHLLRTRDLVLQFLRTI